MPATSPREMTRVVEHSEGEETPRPAETSALLQENDQLLDLIPKEDFHSKRWRCISRPDNAAHTLGPWALLDIEIVGATDLVASEVNMFRATSNAVCKVSLDDLYQFKTHPKRSLNPEWNFEGRLDITDPRSMVRFQVADESQGFGNDAGTGFVEFCVADLPFNKTIEGFMELRFHENLQRTSGRRYAEHRKRRDDGAAREHHEHGKEELMSEHSSGKGDPLERVLSVDSFTKFSKERVRGGMMSCGCKKPPPSISRGEAHLNAGELFVRLTFRRISSSWDYAFALALKTPYAKDFGEHVQETAELPALNVQKLYDESREFKTMLFDDACLYVWNYITYICLWRSFFLSLVLTVIFVATCAETWLFPVTCPGILALGMILNYFPSVRKTMTVSGRNAKLSPAGFEDVASARETTNTMSFLSRVIEDFEGKCQDQHQLRNVAVRCCRDGKPFIPFEDLKRELKVCSWITVDKKELVEGALVLLDERYRCTVKKLKKAHALLGPVTEVLVEYEQPDLHDGKTEDWVKRERVAKRDIGYSTIPSYLVPSKVDSEVRKLQYKMAQVKLVIEPKLVYIANVLTWRNCPLAFLITSILTGITGFGIFMFYKEMTSSSGVAHTNPIATMILDSSDNVAVCCLGLVVLLMNARWFQSCCAVGRSLTALCCLRRRAPKDWAFFRESQWRRQSV